MCVKRGSRERVIKARGFVIKARGCVIKARECVIRGYLEEQPMVPLQSDSL